MVYVVVKRPAVPVHRRSAEPGQPGDADVGLSWRRDSQVPGSRLAPSEGPVEAHGTGFEQQAPLFLRQPHIFLKEPILWSCPLTTEALSIAQAPQAFLETCATEPVQSCLSILVFSGCCNK